MKIRTTRRIGFFEVNANLFVRLRSLLNCMQEAAAIHSQQAGYETHVLMEKQRAWVLHRIAVEVHRPPACGDEIEIVTWHKGSRGFRSYRDFEVYRDGEKLVSAASLWLFIDPARKKILRPPQNVGDCYGVEPWDALETDINKWKSPPPFEPEAAVRIAVRASDYDPLGHVNNALYFDYLETLIERGLGRQANLRRIIVQFNREISTEVSEVRVGLKKAHPGLIFSIDSAAGTHAAGTFELQDG